MVIIWNEFENILRCGVSLIQNGPRCNRMSTSSTSLRVAQSWLNDLTVAHVCVSSRNYITIVQVWISCLNRANILAFPSFLLVLIGPIFLVILIFYPLVCGQQKRLWFSPLNKTFHLNFFFIRAYLSSVSCILGIELNFLRSGWG